MIYFILLLLIITGLAGWFLNQLQSSYKKKLIEESIWKPCPLLQHPDFFKTFHNLTDLLQKEFFNKYTVIPRLALGQVISPVNKTALSEKKWLLNTVLDFVIFNQTDWMPIMAIKLTHPKQTIATDVASTFTKVHAKLSSAGIFWVIAPGGLSQKEQLDQIKNVLKQGSMVS